jgi:hypothetical protein
MIAANGMVLIHQALIDSPSGSSNHNYLDAAIRIAKDTIDMSLANDPAPFRLHDDGTVDVAKPAFESILKNATANNNEWALFRYSDHGLVYADYYFLELGNKLLRMGLV